MRVIQKALTFDDVLLVPAHSTVLPREVSLSTRLTRTIQLNIPLLSAAMDTVTEARLAIAMAQAGGIGVIHRNLEPDQQAAQVRVFDAGGSAFDSICLRVNATSIPGWLPSRCAAKSHTASNGFPAASIV